MHDCLDPAIKGTTGILRSIKEHAPSVKRVVVTSSSAAMLQVGDPPQHPAVYNESSWCNVTWEMAMDQRYTYPASKVRQFQTSSPTLIVSSANNELDFCRVGGVEFCGSRISGL